MEFKEVRSNRKSMASEIKGNKLISRAPLQATDEDINCFMLRNKKWFKPHLVKTQAREKADEGPHKLTQEENVALSKRALEVISERVAHYTPLVDVTHGRITILRQESRWGNRSSKGNLKFNGLLMFTPPKVIVFIAMHEHFHRAG